MSKAIMTRTGLQDNYFRDKNAANTQKYNRQLKKVNKIYNSNLKDTNLKSFPSHKRLEHNKITLPENNFFPNETTILKIQ